MSFLACLGAARSLPQGHQAKLLPISSHQLGQDGEAQSRAELTQGGESPGTSVPETGLPRDEQTAHAWKSFNKAGAKRAGAEAEPCASAGTCSRVPGPQAVGRYLYMCPTGL